MILTNLSRYMNHVFGGEKKSIYDCIDSTFVSSVGKYVDRFEEMIRNYTKARYAIATVNGTNALAMALELAGVEMNEEVITQPLTFVATANAISYKKAIPIFIDVDKNTLSLSPEALQEFLSLNCRIVNGLCFNQQTNRIIRACVPMHTFGFPGRIDEVIEICNRYNIDVVEDSAESLGSLYKGQHTGTFGKLGIYSFNGNKTITCGGGGVIVTNNEKLAKLGKHLTTTAKVPHKWEYSHDHIAYNYRMPNLNAALACAQLEQLDDFIASKRKLALRYQEFFKNDHINFFSEPKGSKSNYWLNTILVSDKPERDSFLEQTNSAGIMTRPAWQLLNTLPMFRDSPYGDLSNSISLANQIVNIPSSINIHI